MSYKYKITSTSWNGLNVYCRKFGNILQISVAGTPDKELVEREPYDVCEVSFLHNEFNLVENYIPMIEYNIGAICQLYTNDNQTYKIRFPNATLQYGYNLKAVATVVVE